MTERREHFALDWIKRELDETLKTARVALEGYAEMIALSRATGCPLHLAVALAVMWRGSVAAS